MATTPFEVIAQPFTLYIAAVGTVFPDLDDTPGASWTKIGSSGDLNYMEDGVTVMHNQEVELWRSLGSPGPRKAFRAEEELHITLTVADLTMEQYSLALDYNTVTTVAPATGVPGYKKVGLSRGLDASQKALLVRGNGSPYGDNWKMQYEVPVAVQVGEPEVVFVKGEPAGLALEFVALEDPNAASTDERFGRILAQNANAL